jgi:hypothetical protein
MKKFFPRKGVSLGVLAALALSLAPALAIAQYAHAFGDDFGYSYSQAVAWRETGSLAQTLLRAVQTVATAYERWQGTFSGVFFMALQPAVFGEHFYGAGLMAVTLLFVAALFFFLKVVLVDCLKGDKPAWLIVASVTAALSIHFVYAPLEAFYWYNAAVYYTGFTALSLTLGALLVRILKRPAPSAKARAPWVQGAQWGVAWLLSAVVGGGNFPNLLLMILVTALASVYAFAKGHKARFVPLVCFVLLCAGLGISALAPGNAVRQAYIVQVENLRPLDAVSAIVDSFPQAAAFIPQATHLPVYLAVLAITPLLYHLAAQSGYAFRLPGAALALAFGLYAATFTPALYTTSAFGPDRVLNFNYHCFLLFLLAAVLYLCGWWANKSPRPRTRREKKRARQAAPNFFDSFFDRWGGVLAAAATAGCLCACLALALKNPQAITGVGAAASLLNGEARQYRQEHLRLLEIFAAAGPGVVEVPAFTARPPLIFTGDHNQDADYEGNYSAALWYGVEAIRLEGE